MTREIEDAREASRTASPTQRPPPRRWARTVLLAVIERGGPSVEAPARIGFGTRMIDRSVQGQLRGAVERDWSKEGIIVTMKMDKGRLLI